MRRWGVGERGGGRNSRKRSSERVEPAPLIGSSSDPARRAALYGGSKLLRFNVFAAVAALTEGAIHNTGVIEGGQADQ